MYSLEQKNAFGDSGYEGGDIAKKNTRPAFAG